MFKFVPAASQLLDQSRFSGNVPEINTAGKRKEESIHLLVHWQLYLTGLTLNVLQLWLSALVRQYTNQRVEGGETYVEEISSLQRD